MNQISYVVRKYSREKMRDIDMNAALLHHWFCAALHLCSGKTQVCSEQGKPGKKIQALKENAANYEVVATCQGKQRERP